MQEGSEGTGQGLGGIWTPPTIFTRSGKRHHKKHLPPTNNDSANTLLKLERLISPEVKMKVPVQSPASDGKPYVEAESENSGSEDNIPVSLSTRSLRSTLVACFGTVVCTVLGTGMLGTPQVLMQSGWVMGSLLIVFFAAAASYAICKCCLILIFVTQPFLEMQFYGTCFSSCNITTNLLLVCDLYPYACVHLQTASATHA